VNKKDKKRSAPSSPPQTMEFPMRAKDENSFGWGLLFHDCPASFFQWPARRTLFSSAVLPAKRPFWGPPVRLSGMKTKAGRTAVIKSGSGETGRNGICQERQGGTLMDTPGDRTKFRDLFPSGEFPAEGRQPAPSPCPEASR